MSQYEEIITYTNNGNKLVTVTPIQGSRCAVTGQEIFTLVLEYPRAIHSQLLTHRVFSKNSSSSRAIPVKKMIEQMENDPCGVVWTENQKGMQGTVIEDKQRLDGLDNSVSHLSNIVGKFCTQLSDKLGVHKQNVNRYLEPFTNIKIVLTATDWENWDWLRDDPDAQGEIKELARAIKVAREVLSAPENIMELKSGEYHVPFVNRSRHARGHVQYWVGDQELLTLGEAVEISVSCCAQTSYRNLDTSKEKAESIIPKLFKVRKVHASPTEHQATPIPEEMPSANDTTLDFFQNLPEGVTHVDRYLTPCSGNFKNFIQYRQLIPFHDKALFGEDELEEYEPLKVTEETIYSVDACKVMELLSKKYPNYFSTGMSIQAEFELGNDEPYIAHIDTTYKLSDQELLELMDSHSTGEFSGYQQGFGDNLPIGLLLLMRDGLLPIHEKLELTDPT